MKNCHLAEAADAKVAAAEAETAKKKAVAKLEADNVCLLNNT